TPGVNAGGSNEKRAESRELRRNNSARLCVRERRLSIQRNIPRGDRGDGCDAGRIQLRSRSTLSERLRNRRGVLLGCRTAGFIGAATRPTCFLNRRVGNDAGSGG